MMVVVAGAFFIDRNIVRFVGALRTLIASAAAAAPSERDTFQGSLLSECRLLVIFMVDEGQLENIAVRKQRTKSQFNFQSSSVYLLKKRKKNFIYC